MTTKTTAPPKPRPARTASGAYVPVEVSSSEFAGRFGHWAFEAQSAPIKVMNNKTGQVLGYFVSAREFYEFARLRDRLPRAIPAWELDEEMLAELAKPLPDDYPDLDYLMDDEIVDPKSR
jgi:hypothetical protein